MIAPLLVPKKAGIKGVGGMIAPLIKGVGGMIAPLIKGVGGIF